MASLLQSVKEDTSERTPELRGPILLVEDNPDDAFLIGLAWKQLGLVSLVTVPDGQAAIQYLKAEGPYTGREPCASPQLILLDLDMPVMSGFQFLEWIRQEETLKDLPVIVLTTSTFSPDVNRAYQLGANSFLAKPAEFTQLSAALKGVADFWLPSAEMPTRTASMDKAAGA